MQSKVCVSLSKARTHIHIYIEIKRTQSYLVFFLSRNSSKILKSMYFTFQTCRIVLHLDDRCIFLFFHSGTYPRFHVQVCACWFAFNFFFTFTATTEEQLLLRLALPLTTLFFLIGLCCLTRVEGSLFHQGRESNECMRCGGLFPAHSQIFFLFYAKPDLFLEGWTRE